MRRPRRGLSACERVELWRRWKDGQSLSDIGRALGKPPGSVHGFLSSAGGIEPQMRRRGPRTLSLADREEISRGVSSGKSLRSIAGQLGRAPSTVSREIRRNSGRRWYRAASADLRALLQSRRPKRCKLAEDGRLRRFVASRLRLDWSPEQISGWLKREFPDDRRMRISHETIYRSLFIQARGVLK